MNFEEKKGGNQETLIMEGGNDIDLTTSKYCILNDIDLTPSTYCMLVVDGVFSLFTSFPCPLL